MKLTVLTDNNTYIDKYYIGEPGVSYYIEDEGTRLLWDTGYSDVYLQNAKAMGLDLSQVDAIVLSHSHNDHTRGLTWFPRQDGTVPLIAHPLTFVPRRWQEVPGGEFVSGGAPFSEEEAARRFPLRLSREPVKVSPHITFLGEIPRISGFENQKPVGERETAEGWVPDFMPEDSALVYETEAGIYVITACSHSGICNILAYAKAVTGKRRILGLIGGFHLFPEDGEQIEKTAEFLAIEQIPELYPCHCTSFAARLAIHQKLPTQEVGVGLELNW